MRRAAVLAMLIVAGCDRGPPAGDVVARVDGVEITRRDLLVELAATGAAADVDVAKVQPALLDQIVARKLVAAEARRQALDRTPEFLGQERRSRELILADQLAQRVTGRLAPPDAAAIARQVIADRSRFDDRQMLRVDRLRTDIAMAGLVGQPASVDAAARMLAGRRFDRATVALDTLALAPAEAAALARAAPGRAVIVRSGGAMLIEAVLGRERRPLSPAERAETAAAELRASASKQALDATLARLRRRARIEYQPSTHAGPVG